jgi:hypothetical protein
MRSIFLTFLLLLVNFIYVAAQTFPSDIWHEGKVVLVSEDTIKGPVKYDFENDIVQINNGGQIQAYGARKIIFFEIFDQSIGEYRQFFALPFKVKPNYMVPIFFEVLEEGELTLLSRETVIQEAVPQYDYYTRGSYHYARYRLIYDFYFLNKKGDIKKFDMKKRNLLNTLKPYTGEVKSFMKKNKLKYEQRDDLIKIIGHYNEFYNK